MESQGGEEQRRTVGPVVPVVHPVELGQVPERERLDSVTAYLAGHARLTVSLFKPVHGAWRDLLETERPVEALCP
jgi:hypothetical protein